LPAAAGILTPPCDLSGNGGDTTFTNDGIDSALSGARPARALDRARCSSATTIPRIRSFLRSMRTSAKASVRPTSWPGPATFSSRRLSCFIARSIAQESRRSCMCSRQCRTASTSWRNSRKRVKQLMT
jgi:hypothetical protein